MDDWQAVATAEKLRREVRRIAHRRSIPLDGERAMALYAAALVEQIEAQERTIERLRRIAVTGMVRRPE